ELALPAAPQLGDAFVEPHRAEGRPPQISVRAVPRLVAFEKQHLVATVAQSTHQAAIGRRVAVTPGRGDRQPENDDTQRPRRRRQYGRAHGSLPTSTSSTRRTRCV